MLSALTREKTSALEPQPLICDSGLQKLRVKTLCFVSNQSKACQCIFCEFVGVEDSQAYNQLYITQDNVNTRKEEIPAHLPSLEYPSFGPEYYRRAMRHRWQALRGKC